jgi:CheY-like chemotaxis protein
MKKIALIIDDDEAIRDVLAYRIESIGFDHEHADSQNAAMEHLRNRRFDLILLDQELPVRKGKPTNKEVGRNILAQIRENGGLNQETPVIIVTAHDGNDTIVACDFMSDGADYFLPKPKIDQLGQKIREVLSKRSRKIRASGPETVKTEPARKPFPGGKLEWQTDGIFLGEFRLASQSSNIGRVLSELARQASTGKKRSVSGKSLAERLGLERGNPAIAEAVSPFRRKIAEDLKAAGYEADSDTIIATGRGGYELARNIEVEAESVETPPSDSADPTSEERVAWFIAEAEAGRKPRKALHVKRFGISESTWKRDLKLISEHLEVVGTGGAAYYMPKSAKIEPRFTDPMKASSRHKA